MEKKTTPPKTGVPSQHTPVSALHKGAFFRARLLKKKPLQQLAHPLFGGVTHPLLGGATPIAS